LGSQLANMVHSPVHSDCTVTRQEPSLAQQVPLGCGQGLGSQRVLDPRQVAGEAQFASVVTVQLPVGAQQAPVGTSTPVPVSRT